MGRGERGIFERGWASRSRFSVGFWVALPLRVLEADLIHPRGEPVGG